MNTQIQYKSQSIGTVAFIKLISIHGWRLVPVFPERSRSASVDDKGIRMKQATMFENQRPAKKSVTNGDCRSVMTPGSSQ